MQPDSVAASFWLEPFWQAIGCLYEQEVTIVVPYFRTYTVELQRTSPYCPVQQQQAAEQVSSKRQEVQDMFKRTKGQAESLTF